MIIQQILSAQTCLQDTLPFGRTADAGVVDPHTATPMNSTARHKSAAAGQQEAGDQQQQTHQKKHKSTATSACSRIGQTPEIAEQLQNHSSRDTPVMYHEKADSHQQVADQQQRGDSTAACSISTPGLAVQVAEGLRISGNERFR
jgi:hypothetical protein